MIPGRPLLFIVAATALLAIAAAAWPDFMPMWIAAAAALAFAAAVDAILALRGSIPVIERTLPGSMAIMTWVRVSLTARNHARRGVMHLRIYDHHPDFFKTRGLPIAVDVAAGRFADTAYRVMPLERGMGTFPGVELRLRSPLRLWWRRRLIVLPSTVRVYPNYSTISKLLAYEVDNRLHMAGVRLSRRRGEGIEFHQLRDYREGDGLRSIDWKATNRMGRLIAREYQDERDQQVVFVLDAGRRMLARDGELSHFDHTLNAMLLLSYVALRQGDAVGIMTVSQQRAWLPPAKGAAAINSLLNHVYDVQPMPVEVDYTAAATELAVRQRRRSLVIFLSNIRDEDAEDITVATELLKRRHLVMLASLRERAIDGLLASPVSGFGDALTFAAANQYLLARRESHDLLRARGVLVEDCLSDELPAAITNRYLAIKRAGML